jgi:DNA helicase HerA-like ATPase
VRMTEHSGMLTNDASTTYFTFVISPLKNRAQIEKNDYIALNHPILGETSPILAVIKEIKSYEHVAGSTLREKVGKMMATAKIIGYVNLGGKNKQILPLATPPNPGSRVYLLYSEFMQQIYATDIDGNPFTPPLRIGKAYQTAINKKEDNKRLVYYLDPKNLTKSHTLITAIDNSGKTYTATVIIEELVSKTSQSVIIFDPYNEYETIATPRKQEYQIDNIDSQKTKENLTELIQQKQVTIITTKTSEDKTNTYSKILSTLWNARTQKNLPPLTIVIENAEKLDPSTLEPVVYEGTKYDIALILISKQPTLLGKKILSQMGTQIIGRTRDSDYLSYLKTILPKHVTEIPQLKEKEWIINTNSQLATTKITTRERLTK